MKIEDFLEKKEMIQVDILKKIILEGGTYSFQLMRGFLEISKASLESYLAEIQLHLVLYDGACQLHYDGRLLGLVISSDFSISTVYRDYVKRSLKFQLLDYVFQHREFTAVKIARDLIISESSLFRKIKEVNESLKEFKVQIKNGRLQGEELQIRYFYFQMYWLLTPYSVLEENLLTEQNLRLITGFEKELDISFSEFSRVRICLWLMLSKRRASLPGKNYRTVKHKMKAYETDLLYVKIRRLVLLYFSRYSIEVEEEETMLHYLFLTTMSVLSEQDFSVYDLTRSRRTPTAVADTFLRETLLLHYRPQKPSIELERQINYYLSQTNGRLYFFSGDLLVYDQEAFVSRESNHLSDHLQQLAEQLLDTALAHFQETSIVSEAKRRVALTEYLNVLAVIDFKISKELRVGIDLKMIDLYADMLTQVLMLNLKNLIGVTVEVYKPQREYDLIITNSLPLVGISGRTETYLLSEFYSPYDIEQIKERITKLKL